jgi:hypothetical protein
MVVYVHSAVGMVWNILLVEECTFKIYQKLIEIKNKLLVYQTMYLVYIQRVDAEKIYTWVSIENKNGTICSHIYVHTICSILCIESICLTLSIFTTIWI